MTCVIPLPGVTLPATQQMTERTYLAFAADHATCMKQVGLVSPDGEKVYVKSLHLPRPLDR